MKRVAIIGAGRFGMSLTEALADAGVEVLLIEKNGTLVQSATKFTHYAVQGDATNALALESAGIKECDVAVVAIGSNIEASMLAVANCKDLGVDMVVAKATNEIHGKILDKIGADRVVYPDRDSAHRLARSLTDHGALDLLEVSEGFSIAEIDVPDFCKDKSLAQSELRNKHGVTVLCIRRADENNPRKPRQIMIPGPNDVLDPGDKLIVFGKTHDIDALG